MNKNIVRLLLVLSVALVIQAYVHSRHAHNFNHIKNNKYGTEDEDNAVSNDGKKREEITDPNQLEKHVLEQKQWIAIENQGKDIKGDAPGVKVRYGDIMISDSQNEEYFGVATKKKVKKGKKGKHEKKDAITDESALWSHDIPMTIDENLKNSSLALLGIMKATKEIENKTCLRFLTRETQKDYINFFKGDGCWSYLGQQGGRQNISLGLYCEAKSTVVHEIMHALGFIHEVQRQDRDKYVFIATNNTNEEDKAVFKKATKKVTTHDQPYDYFSVMHYYRLQFGKYGYWGHGDQRYAVTLKADDQEALFTFGQQLDGGLSQIDQRQLNQMYCEVPRPVGVISTDKRFGLETYLRHRLDEYTQLDYKDIHQMLFEKLAVTFPGYKFSINVFRTAKDITKSTFLCENCIYKLDHLGKDVVIGYSKVEAPVPKEDERTALAAPLKEAVEKLKTCDAQKISAKVYTEVSKLYPVTMVLTTDMDLDLATGQEQENALNTFVRCPDETTMLIVVMFGE